MKFFYFLLICFHSHASFSQGFLDDISGKITSEDLVTEKIKKISPTKRIFIISNQNNSFDVGDYISIVFLDKITARAIVAKAKNDYAGLKIIKINSWSHWQKLLPGANIQIIRGDDSKFVSASDKNDDESQQTMINDENDLYNDVIIDDEILEVDDSKNRLIKPDHLLTLNYGSVDNIDAAEQMTTYQQFIISYSYQIRDNLWLEGTYGQNVIRDFPTVSIDTTLRQLSFRAKYSFKLPFYSYALPYIGFVNSSGDSPQAGLDPSGNTSDADLQQELRLVDALGKNNIIFGVSLLRHLAPGWYARLDIGSDAIFGGFGLEF